MDENEQKKKKYDVALATRNFEIELFWKRSVFFWGFIASAFVGYATLIKNEESIAIVVACFGFVCSVAWSLVNRGSKYWQENWESIVVSIEKDVTGDLFTSRAEQQKKGVWLTSRKFSVSKVTIALSDFTVMIWTVIMFYHLTLLLPMCICVPDVALLTILLIIFSIIFSIFMAVAGRSSD